MNKRVLLIQPRHGIWDGVFIRFPESVLSIAALPHAKGYDVTILDLRVTPRWEVVLQSYLAENKPICVGITSLTGPSLKDLLRSVEIIKEHDNSIPIVFGGVHATLLPEQSLYTVPGVDVVVTFEGDSQVVLNRTGCIFHNGHPGGPKDMDSYCAPACDGMFKGYADACPEFNGEMPVCMSRGTSESTCQVRFNINGD